MAFDWGADIVRRAIVANQNQKKKIYPLGVQTALSNVTTAHYYGAVKDYAILAGGQSNSSTPLLFANGYNVDLVRSIISSLSSARRDGASAFSKAHCLFAGGRLSGTTAVVVSVECFDNNLVKTALADLSNGRFGFFGVFDGSHYIFAGGRIDASSSIGVSHTDAFDLNLTKVTIPALSSPRIATAGVKCGNRSLFMGGHNNNVDSPSVDVYDENLILSAAPNLPLAGTGRGASNHNFAYFANHQQTAMYDKNLIMTSIDKLDPARSSLGTTSNDDFAVFAGGLNISRFANIESFDINGVKEVQSPLSQARVTVGANVGNKFIFAGGDNGTAQSTVDAYEIK